MALPLFIHTGLRSNNKIGRVCLSIEITANFSIHTQMVRIHFNSMMFLRALIRRRTRLQHLILFLRLFLFYEMGCLEILTIKQLHFIISKVLYFSCDNLSFYINSFPVYTRLVHSYYSALTYKRHKMLTTII